MSSLRKRIAFLPLAVAVLAAGPVTHAQVVLTSTWIGSTGNWSNGLLWLVPPQTGYNVVINNIVLPADVSLDVSATINQLSLGTGAILRINDGRNLQLNASSTIDGTLFMNSTGGSTELRIGAPNLTLSGSGTINMSANAGNHIRGAGSSDSLINQVTIQGGGAIGANQLSLLNQGTIIANSSSVPLVIEPNASGVTNTGTLRATAGGTLELKNGIFTNTGGTILADANSHIDVTNSTIIGGTLSSVGTGHFHALGSIFSGVTISTGSNVELTNGDTLTLLGNIVNNGVISLLATSGSNELRMDGAVTLSGSGSVILSDDPSNRFSAASAGSMLTIGASQTVSGAGNLGRNNLLITNQGTILANQTNRLVIDNAANGFTNNGVLKATGVGGIRFNDTAVTNFGIVEIASGSLVDAAGTFMQSGVGSATKLAGGTLTSTGFDLQNGSLGGSGTINGAVTATSTGTLLPGGAGTVGSLAFTSSLNLGPTTSVYFDLGGRNAGTSHDVISGTNITLDGSLFLSFTNGFQSSITPSDTLTLISASTTLNGTFASLSNGSRLTTLDGFGSFQVNYQANAFTLSDFQAIPEPSTYILLTIGGIGALFAERRRRRVSRSEL